MSIRLLEPAQAGVNEAIGWHAEQSESTAAMALMGRSANGWVEWKAANCQTLDELKRQTVSVVG